jgi:hypothetical protein
VQRSAADCVNLLARRGSAFVSWCTQAHSLKDPGQQEALAAPLIIGEFSCQKPKTFGSRADEQGIGNLSHLRPTRADYTLFGWRTRSDMRLTGVPTSMCGNENVDVLIQIEPVIHPQKNCSGAFEHSGRRLAYQDRRRRGFETLRGQQIRVWPATGAVQKGIEIFMLGLAWATLSFAAARQRDHDRERHYSVCWALWSGHVDDRGLEEFIGLRACCR